MCGLELECQPPIEWKETNTKRAKARDLVKEKGTEALGRYSSRGNRIEIFVTTQVRSGS